MGLNFELILHLFDHWLNHFSKRCVKKSLREVKNIIWNVLSEKEIAAFICKVVAVVSKHIVSLVGEARADVFKEFHKDFLVELGRSQGNSFKRLS